MQRCYKGYLKYCCKRLVEVIKIRPRFPQAEKIKSAAKNLHPQECKYDNEEEE